MQVMSTALVILTLNEVHGAKELFPRIKKEWVDEFCISNKLFQYQPLLYAIKGHKKTFKEPKTFPDLGSLISISP